MRPRGRKERAKERSGTPGKFALREMSPPGKISGKSLEITQETEEKAGKVHPRLHRYMRKRFSIINTPYTHRKSQPHLNKPPTEKPAQATPHATHN